MSAFSPLVDPEAERASGRKALVMRLGSPHRQNHFTGSTEVPGMVLMPASTNGPKDIVRLLKGKILIVPASTVPGIAGVPPRAPWILGVTPGAALR